MKRRLAITVVLTGLLMCFPLSILRAQEEEVATEYSWGVVKSVSSEQLVVTEYDYDSGEEIDVTYTIDPAAELINVDSLKDIAVGDTVDIEYVVKVDEKVTRVITVEKSSYEEEEEYTPSETYKQEE